MAETTNKRGRKPSTASKATAETTVEEVSTTSSTNDDMAIMLAEMQLQMAEMKKELENTKKEKEEVAGQNLDLQTLVDALKASASNSGVDGNLPNYVTVISLIPNVYNLSTEPNGRGTSFSFAELGESKVISLSNVQKIMGVSKYRQQAEEGYFYIADDGVNNYFRLEPTNNTVEDIKNILSLNSDEAVDKFVALNEVMQESLADKMALDIVDGKKIDKNRLGDILDKTGIDIESKARSLKKILNK